MSDHDNRYEDMSEEEYVEDASQNDWEAEQIARTSEQLAQQDDPHFYDFIPGYPTEMDYLNSLEADDYINEMSDLDG